LKTVLVVEDHQENSAWLSLLLEEAFAGVVIKKACTLAEAMALISKEDFSLAIVDIGLPDGNGIELVSRLQAKKADTYVVMATIYDDDEHLFSALQAGAHGYLLKDQPRSRLLAQLKGIAQGEPALSPSIARRVLRYFRQKPASTASFPALSDREVEVLRLLARGFTRGDIAAALDVTANTVATYTKSIYRKLGVSGRAEAAMRAVAMGVVSSGD
jgi:DNA-binding NarL/FixJ family response regulator